MASFHGQALPTPRSLIERRAHSARGQLRQPTRSQPSTPSFPPSSQPCQPLALGPRPSQPVPPAVSFVRPVSAGISPPSRSSVVTAPKPAARPATAAPVTALRPVTPTAPAISAAQPASALERPITAAAHLPVSGILLENALRRGLLPTPRPPSFSTPAVTAEGDVSPDLDGTEQWSEQRHIPAASPDFDALALKIESRIEASEVEQRRQLTRLAFQKTYTQALRRDLQSIVGDAEGPSDGSDIAARLDMIAEHIGRVQDSIAQQRVDNAAAADYAANLAAHEHTNVRPTFRALTRRIEDLSTALHRHEAQVATVGRRDIAARLKELTEAKQAHLRVVRSAFPPFATMSARDRAAALALTSEVDMDVSGRGGTTSRTSASAASFYQSIASRPSTARAPSTLDLQHLSRASTSASHLFDVHPSNFPLPTTAASSSATPRPPTATSIIAPRPESERLATFDLLYQQSIAPVLRPTSSTHTASTTSFLANLPAGPSSSASTPRLPTAPASRLSNPVTPRPVTARSTLVSPTVPAPPMLSSARPRSNMSDAVSSTGHRPSATVSKDHAATAVSGIELFPTPPAMWVRRDFTLQHDIAAAHPQLPSDDHLADHQPEHDPDPSLDLRDQLSASAARGFDDNAMTQMLRACQAMGQYDDFDNAVSHIVYQCQQLMRADRITAYLRIGNKRLWSKAAVGLTKPIVVPTSSSHSAAASAFRRRASYRLLSTQAIGAAADDDDDATVVEGRPDAASAAGEPLPDEQPSLDPGSYDAQCQYTTQSCLSVPVFAAHNTNTSGIRGDPPPIGVLELLNKTRGTEKKITAFSAPDEIIATLLADEMGRQWHASQLRQQVADINRTLALAYTMSDMVANQVNTGLLLSDLCELLAIATRSAYCVLFTVDHGKHLMMLRHFREFADCTGTVVLPLTSPGILGAVMSSGKTCIAAGQELSTTAGFPEIAALMLHDLEVTSTLAAPVVQNITGAIIGVVQLVNKRDALPYLAADVRMVESWAAWAAVAIEHTVLIEREMSQKKRNMSSVDTLKELAVNIEQVFSVNM